ncbi:hypothetical protein D3C87_1879110 [compost metagenome]
MDQQLGAKAEGPGAARFRGKCGVIADCGANAIHGRGQTRRAGMKHQPAAEVVQRFTVVLHVEIEHQVDAAEQQPDHAAGTGQLA